MNFIPVDDNFNLVAMQRFFDSFEQKREFFTNTEAGRRLWEGVQEKLGLKILAYIPPGPGCYFSTERPLDSVAALKGLKARYLMVTEKPSFDALGVSYVSVATSEVYTALKQGMINTLMTVPSAIVGYNWWEYLKYAQLPYNTYFDGYIAANKRWWDNMPNDLQEIVLNEVAPKISKLATDKVMDYSNDILKEFVEKHGGRIDTLSESELHKLQQMDLNVVWPKIAEGMDPDFWAAAKKFRGFK
jgi:TRAP-type C4-dicarboxylate transport system substrate-binding protein